MLSYVPFRRNIQLQNVQNMIDSAGMDNISAYHSNSHSVSRVQEREGLYEDFEGKSVDYKDRLSDQEEIRLFTDNIFKTISKCIITANRIMDRYSMNLKLFII